MFAAAVLFPTVAALHGDVIPNSIHEHRLCDESIYSGTAPTIISRENGYYVAPEQRIGSGIKR